MNKIRSTALGDVESSYESLKRDIVNAFIHVNYKYFYETSIHKKQLGDKSSLEEELSYRYNQIVPYQQFPEYDYNIPLFDNNRRIIFTEDTSEISYDWFKNKIVAVADYSEVVPGNYTAVEQVISDILLQERKEIVLQWINQVFLDESDSKTVIANLLFAVSHMEYEDVCPVGPTVAMLALNNSNPVLVELAIHAFENWNSKDSVTYLKSYRPDDEINRKNWDRVIKYLEENGE